MDSAAFVPWVPIASFMGIYAEVEADLLVAHLEGSGIPPCGGRRSRSA